MKKLAALILVASSLVIAAAPAAGAASAPCRITARQFQTLRVGTPTKAGMTRAYVKAFIGCGGRVDYTTPAFGVTYRGAASGVLVGLEYRNDRLAYKASFSLGD